MTPSTNLPPLAWVGRFFGRPPIPSPFGGLPLGVGGPDQGFNNGTRAILTHLLLVCQVWHMIFSKRKTVLRFEMYCDYVILSHTIPIQEKGFLFQAHLDILHSHFYPTPAWKHVNKLLPSDFQKTKLGQNRALVSVISRGFVRVVCQKNA